MTTSARTTSTSTPYVKQPDRHVKLECPNCGAIARMTNIAIRLTGGITCSRDGVLLAPAPARPYRRRAS